MWRNWESHNAGEVCCRMGNGIFAAVAPAAIPTATAWLMSMTAGFLVVRQFETDALPGFYERYFD